MEENKIFRWIWRISNLAVLVAMIAFFYLFYINEIKKKKPYLEEPSLREVITSVAEDPKGLEKWVLQDTYAVRVKEYTFLSLVSKNGEVQEMHYSAPRPYYGNSAKNILVINTKDNSSSWLFKGNNQLILRYSSEVAPNRIPYQVSMKETPPEFIYYQVVDHDTNGDKILSQDDKPNFAISDISGKNYKEIIKEIDRIITIKMIDSDTILLVYQKEGKGYTMKLDIKHQKVLSDEVIPKVSK